MHTFLFFCQFKPLRDSTAKILTMNDFDLHPEFYNYPISLTTEEQHDPLIVIRTFIEDLTFIEVRIQLYRLLEVVLTKDDTIYDDVNRRDAALYFSKRLERIIEATFLSLKND
jgi:hypothetical protein